MMYREFIELSECNISFEQYNKIIEPMYMAVNMDKDEFIKFIRPSARALAKENEKKRNKNIRKMCVRDRSGNMKTPNGAYYHIVYVELLDIDIATGKYIVAALEEYDFEKLSKNGNDLNYCMSYDMDYTDCIDKKGNKIVLK